MSISFHTKIDSALLCGTAWTALQSGSSLRDAFRNLASFLPVTVLSWSPLFSASMAGRKSIEDCKRCFTDNLRGNIYHPSATFHWPKHSHIVLSNCTEGLRMQTSCAQKKTRTVSFTDILQS